MNNNMQSELIKEKKKLVSVEKQMINQRSLYEQLCNKRGINTKKLFFSSVFLSNFVYFLTLFLSDISIIGILLSIIPVELGITGISYHLVKLNEIRKNQKIFNAFLDFTKSAKNKEIIEKRIKELEEKSEEELENNKKINKDSSPKSEEIKKLNNIKDELISIAAKNSSKKMNI